MTSHQFGPSRAATARRLSGVGGETVRAEIGAVGKLFPLFVLWLLFDIGRPWTPRGVPLLITAVLFIHWLSLTDKNWSKQNSWWLVVLGTAALGVVMAPNEMAAGIATWGLAIVFFGICFPLQAMVTSTQRLRFFVYGFLAVVLYANGWAMLHHGYGPAGSNGGQDENYMAALAGMAIPFAYFSLFLEKRWLPRIFLASVIVVSLGAVAIGSNPSRGGFLGLCAVALYCLALSPKKWLGFGILGFGLACMMLIAGPEFWADMQTSGDYKSGTADLRLEVWKAGLRMFQANPVFGVGAGNFRWVLGDYQTLAQFEKFGRSLAGSMVAHSFWVELLAELGLVGFVATVALMLNVWMGLGKVRKGIPARVSNTDLAIVRSYAAAVRGSILAISVNGIFLSLLYFSHLWLLLALGSSLPFLYRRIVSQGTIGPTARVPVRPMMRGGAARSAPVAPIPFDTRNLT